MDWKISCVCVLIAALGVSGTPLDDYVHAPDPTYSWHLISSYRSVLGYTAHFVNLTSQTWLTAADSSHPVWWHLLEICVPDFLDTSVSSTAFLYIDAGSNDDSPLPPKNIDYVTETLCLESRTVVADLRMVPNQPISFPPAYPHNLDEDGLIAYTWLHFIKNTSAPNWLLRLPMTKAAVRAMDTVQAFVHQQVKSAPAVKQFVVMGASKRGWTTWTTAAVDPRVQAIIPIVMPILSMQQNMNHHWQCLGNWSFALQPYEQFDIFKYLNAPVMSQLTAIVDPMSYVDRYTMPKLMITSTGDEFFMPDSPRYFSDKLVGESHFLTLPNAEHTCATQIVQVVETASAFYRRVLHNVPRPTYNYTITRSNTTASIAVTSMEFPETVRLWQATTIQSERRDFRLLTCEKFPECFQPVLWHSTLLAPINSEPYYYEATVDAPSSGWTGFLIELTWPLKGAPTFRATTEVNVVPDTVPFPPCGDNCQPYSR